MNNKKKNKCYKCHKRQDVLRLTMYYGKPDFICDDCHNKIRVQPKDIIQSYYVASDKIN